MGVMPWEAKTIIEARRQFVAHARRPDANIRALCRAFNISANTAYKLLKRFQVEGEKSLHDRSHRPRHSPFRCSEETERAILSVRADHPTWGGRRIAKQLRLLGAPVAPAASTITAILARHGRIGWPDQVSTVKWMSALEHGGSESPDVPHGLVDHPDLPLLLDRLQNGRLLDRKRSMVILATQRGLRGALVCKILSICPGTYRRCLRVFEGGGAAALFARRINPHRKFDSEVVKKALFAVLHQPPKSFGINRTTWKMADLSRVLRETGQPAGEDVIRKIIKMAGYRWRKARVVLTSNDPDFSQKLGHVRSILSGLKADEAFFSIDEYGPFAVKAQPGTALVGPGERRYVQQWQQSKGCLIVTAAVELSSNQVTHFYSTKKNTAEMIRLMDVLINQYSDRKRLYLSWDAASWHISKQLFARIDEHNASIGQSGPFVETAPLPARAQFLNVIESVFSGMARAVIHNSDYESVDEAKAAIDLYIGERNRHFQEHPRRAGGKIWGKETVPAEFSDSNNCKHPRLG
jgi:transposase